jgi:methionyl-tRNA formyltransferase
MRKYLPKVVFLAADTIRSRVYAQILEHYNYLLDAVLIVESEKKKWGQSAQIDAGNTDLCELFIPNLNKTLESSCEHLSKNINSYSCNSINTPEVIAWLKKIQPNLVIFSGFGGELINSEVLDTSKYFLHIHSGYLPYYRGSTTAYYSYLNDKKIGVTAILMEKSIDSGNMVDRKNYSPPPIGVNFDYLYDSSIRADLLIRALRKYDVKAGIFNKSIERQSEEDAVSYYIIHPLLKHIALNDMKCK